MGTRINARSLLHAYNQVIGKIQTIRSSYNAVKTLDTEHERIHAGKMWEHTQIHSMSTGQIYDHLIVPDSGSDLHLRSADFSSDGGPGLLEVYEAPFTDANSIGTVDTDAWKNLNRKSSNVIPATMYDEPFIDANSIGELLSAKVLAVSGVGQDQIGAKQAATHEWMLDDQKSYLIRYTNNDTGNVTANAEFLIYNSLD